MNNLLKHQFIDVVNEMRIGTAPEWHSEPNVRYEDINDCLFDVVDSRQEPDSIKKYIIKEPHHTSMEQMGIHII